MHPSIGSVARACCLALVASACNVAEGQATGDALAGLESLKSFQAERSSSAAADWRDDNADSKRVAPGETLVIADLHGPGKITHLWNTIATEERGYSRLMVLRMYWDGETEPSVECPIGDFFAAGHGIDAVVNSSPVYVGSNGRARNCYWPMPFRKSARITVTNEGEKPVSIYYYVDWQKHTQIPDDAAYFHAQYRQAFPTPLKQNYVVADLTGRGHYVGTVLSVRTHAPEWWGEGDDLFFLDGETEPRLRGTGTEDYFCDAWGFAKGTGPNVGVSLWNGNETDDGYTTVYHWHLADPIPFTKSLRFEMEHKGVTFDEAGAIVSHAAERSDDFSSVAFWYQLEPHKTFEPIPKGYARLYYSPQDVSEAEALMDHAKATAGPMERQSLPAMSGGAIMLWKPEVEGATIEIPFEIPKGNDADAKFEVTLLLLKSWDYGTYSIAVDDSRPLPWIDLYAPTIETFSSRVTLEPLTSGTHTLKVVNHGKNAASKGHFFGLDGIAIHRR